MNLCPKCTSDVIPGSKYCHRCGEKMAVQQKPCPACKESNPLTSVFCHHCGFHFEGARQRAYQPKFAFDFEANDLPEQVKALFFRSLRQRVEEEHNVSRYADFVERFYQSRFRVVYEVRANQIAADVYKQWTRFGQDALPELDRRIEASFEGLLDFFIISFCPDLHGGVLPETILKHEHVLPGKTDLWNLIEDYLDFDREDETIYFDFITMPQDYLTNACRKYLFAERREKVFFIGDLSIQGNCKEGYAMTDKALYWRVPFDKARVVRYDDIQSLKREKDWLLINGHFFTTNPNLNLKLYKLLKKMRGWRPVMD
jgi:Double zinc ribbon